MIGGDLCAKFPDRMLLCSLFSAKKNSEVNSLVQDLNKQYNFASSLPQKQVEYDYLLKQCSLPINEIATKYPLSSSFGRCLDAAAALFNVCHIRTYQGEPAMRLEGFAYSGIAEKYFDLESYLKGNTIHNEQLLYDYATIIQAKFKSGLTEQTRRNLAKSFLVDMASLFAMQSVNLAQKMDCSKIGLTGGIAVNEIIVETIAKYVQTHDFDFVQHNSVPCGDAGISTGQIAIASSRKE
jgi:hydrogenase maturation protein HypF